MYGKRPEYRDKLDSFLNGLENEKIGSYYLNLDFISKNHKCMKLEITNSTGIVMDAYYKISESKFERINMCQEDVKIILDEHAISTIIMSSYNIKNILFSEFLFGHIKFSGLTFNDMVGAFK